MEKIKSRWRKNYLEDNITDKSNETTVTSNNHHHKHHHSSKHSSPPTYEPISENLYLDKRKNEHSRSKKDARSMVCDCILTKEERARGVMGCLDDCLNRMLMIECGSKCTLGDHCLNKRFQKCQSAKVEVFKTKKKGWGLRAAADLASGTFIMEYVGEVVRSKEFRSRVKKYTKQKVKHHYFMALRSDEIIDATCKGNLTRFINHSCEPNCETQKWTVNGDLRIGFFTIKNLQAGDEITFDYQFQRYGRKAQKCYCEAPSCRGYIGGNQQTYSLNGHSSPQTQESKAHKKAFKHGLLVDVTIEDKINALVEDASNGLKTRDQVIALASLSIKAEQLSDRRKLLNIIQATKSDCSLRLFVDYHGLEIICLWMRDPQADCDFKASIIEVLEKLPIPNRTKVLESNVYRMIERWANEEPKQVTQPAAEINGTTSERVSIDSVDIAKDGDDFRESSQTTPQQKPILNENNDSQQSTSSSTLPQLQQNSPNIKSLAIKLLKKFQNLSPGFKIPRLNRLQRMEIEKKMGEEISNEELVGSSKDRPISDTTNPFARNYFKSTPTNNSSLTNNLHNSSALSKSSNDTLPLKRKFDSITATTTSSSTATTATNNIDLTPAPKLSKKEHREQFELNVKLKDYYDTIEKHYGPIVAEQVKLSHRVLPYLNGFPSMPFPHQMLAGQSLNFPVIPPSLLIPQHPQAPSAVPSASATACGTATQNTNVIYPNVAYPNNYNSVNSSSSTTAQSSPHNVNLSHNHNSGNHHLSSSTIPTLIVLTDHQVEPIDSELAFSLCDYDNYYTQRDKPLEAGDVMTKPYPGSYYTTPDGEQWFVAVNIDRKSNRPKTIVLPLPPVSKTR